ncbi:MAG: hypothetical protein P0Y53_23315 [Candidatus Pseudobacter hemicellulosilyticus]|uniref:Uncharacterized protein n=1 Tax=Candidatus Pseudobacter hemicellulosilyticus TaxID=3121375 RepID=A0AAJ5WTL9_9BACT|nr:MAG: hypothetical protein P0Y53_23315 [Pseudobacter sp.]
MQRYLPFHCHNRKTLLTVRTIIPLPFILLILIASSIASCSKSKSDDLHTVCPVDEPYIYLWSGEDSLLTFDALNNITQVSSDNEEIVKVSLEGQKIRLKAGKVGYTNFWISYGDNKRIWKQARSAEPSFYWINLMNQVSFEIEAADPAFVGTLRAELEKQWNQELLFLFSNSTNRITIVKGNAALVEGNYNFNNLTLTVEIANDVTNVYTVIPNSSRQVLSFQQDLTKQYQDLYPDQQIQKVIVTFNMKYKSLPG